ncbi:tyrosine-type recombinase/integrase [Jatrophihabitans sp. YIM 134969]
MASIAKRPDGQYRARYRDTAGKEHSRHFGRKIDAQRWLDDVTTTIVTGVWVDPGRGRVTVSEWSQRWLEAQSHLKPSTHERYAGILREHVVPRWGAVRLVDVGHADVQAWITGLMSSPRSQRGDRDLVLTTTSISAATVRKVHQVFSLVLKLAVKDGRLSRNPADDVNLPRVVQAEHVYLTHEQVDDLAGRCGPHRLVVLFLAYTGVRFGEMAALRVARLDLMRRRATIAESVTLVRGVQTWGTPKGHLRRAVPIPRFLVDELAAHVAGKAPNDLVFTGEKGGALRAQVFQRSVMTPAVEAMGVHGLHPHSLRHTAASLAIASGANVKVVQQMLGHKTATMTLDLYGHLFADQLDEVADAMDAARSRGLLADQVRTDGVVVALPTGTESATPPGNRGV